MRFYLHPEAQDEAQVVKQKQNTNISIVSVALRH